MSGCDRCNNGPACESGPWEVWLPAALVELAITLVVLPAALVALAVTLVVLTVAFVVLAVVSLKSLAAVEGSLAAN